MRHYLFFFLAHPFSFYVTYLPGFKLKSHDATKKKNNKTKNRWNTWPSLVILIKGYYLIMRSRPNFLFLLLAICPLIHKQSNSPTKRVPWQTKWDTPHTPDAHSTPLEPVPPRPYPHSGLFLSFRLCTSRSLYLVLRVPCPTFPHWDGSMRCMHAGTHAPRVFLDKPGWARRCGPRLFVEKRFDRLEKPYDKKNGPADFAQ